jgi:hypothetical protein
MVDHILRRQADVYQPRDTGASLIFQRYAPEMVNWIGARIENLVYDGGVAPGEIAVLAPFMPDSLRFSLMNRLQLAQVSSYSYRPSRSLRDEPATRCLLTLAALCHPAWGIRVTRQDIRYALMQAIAEMDLVRADLLARIVFKESRAEEGLGSFDRIIPDMRDRITYKLGFQRYEVLREWLAQYRTEPEQELDVFISRMFGEVLSQPGFGFHDNYDAPAVTARLIESIQKFRWAAGGSLQQQQRSTGEEYIRMVSGGVIAAQNLEVTEEPQPDAVLLAPAHTFLMMNRPVSYQFWLDVASQGWWERLLQPLTHPHILSRPLADGSRLDRSGGIPHQPGSIGQTCDWIVTPLPPSYIFMRDQHQPGRARTARSTAASCTGHASQRTDFDGGESCLNPAPSRQKC